MRTRKSSNEQPLTPSSSSGKSKGKSKQVEFSEDVKVNEVASPNLLDDESDLTDLTEVEESIAATTPSPRRLRSNGERPKTASWKGKEKAEEDVDVEKRVTPMRKAKKNVGSMAESDEEEDQLESDAEQEEEEEEDELASPLATPKAARRTPVKRRLRPRRIQTHTPPSDGDDEQSADEDVEESIDGNESSEDDGTTVASNESVDEDIAEEPTAEPRVLRNGKVVGEGEADEESIGDEDEDDEEDEDSQLSTVEEAEAEVEGQADTDEAEDEEAEEPMDDDSA